MVVASPMLAPPQPAIVDCHLEAVQAHKDGGLLLVASNLVSRYWSGSLWYFKDAETAPNYQSFTAAAQAKTGLKDAKWITDMTMASISDSGTIDVYDVSASDQTFNPLWSSCSHDDVCTSLAVNADQTWLISASYDGCIKVWDMAEMFAMYTFRGHSDVVNSLSSHPSQPDTFLSCSRDGNVILWDTRKALPAKRLGALKETSPTCLCWQPKNENCFAVGGADGEIKYVDLRDVGNCLGSAKAHNRHITRMEFSPTSENMLASGSEDCNVVVMNVTQGSPIYRHSHKDFVTGITWSPDGSKLYSCGWDSSVKCHNMGTGECLECGQTSEMEVQNGGVVNGSASASSMDSEINTPVSS
ncbi:methylosome protein WDR77-like [Lineus longissimus]|uniref:methylosome protein WDR77-like n=1 Tax=Lineus longissimus TaxID=88925 RepID=UPI002B4C2A86